MIIYFVLYNIILRYAELRAVTNTFVAARFLWILLTSKKGNAGLCIPFKLRSYPSDSRT